MKLAVCQEMFVGWSWERQCETAARLGYRGLEVAPFTLADGAAVGRPEAVSAGERARLRRVAESFGLEIVGLHWLLAKTTGLHLTTADAGVRRATAEHLSALTVLCGELGGSVMVLGSPLQRSLEGGMSLEVATDNAIEVIRGMLPALEAQRVTLCLEPLTTKETNFWTTCAEVALTIERVNHPLVQLHQDVKAMLGDVEPIPELIAKYAPITKHFHVNDGNLLGPGMGPTNFFPILQALKTSGYGGWLSLEVFDYAAGCEHIAAVSAAYLRGVHSAFEA